MNNIRGLRIIKIAISTTFLFHTFLSTDFWIAAASARYDCGSFWTPQPNPDELVWLPYKTYCERFQTIQSPPSWFLIDDYPDEDLENCMELGTQWRIELEESVGNCSFEPVSSYSSDVSYEIPFACNGSVIYPQEAYYFSAFIENYDRDFDVSCPGYPTKTINLTVASKYFLREPVGPDQVLKEKNRGLPSCGLSAGNPINVATGNKYHFQQDVLFPDGLAIARSYNSNDRSLHSFGSGWRGNYSRKIEALFSGDKFNASLRLIRDDGAENYWRIEDGMPVAPPDAKGKLDVAYHNGQVLGFTFVTNDNSIETYDAGGKLLTIENGRGQILHFTYSNLLLSAVTTTSGRALSYSYNPDGRVRQIDSSSEINWKYYYDANDNLVQVENPDGTIKTYHYENTSFPNALSGESDEKGNRIRSWAYDASGRAILSTYGDADSPIERNTIGYNPNGTTTTTGPLQHSREHTFEITHGVAKFGTVSESCGACADSRESTTYDERGNRDLVTDFEGNTTDYDYTADNLVQKAIYAVGTPQQHEVTYNWDRSVRKPTQIVRGNKVTSFTYNSRGQVLTQTQMDALTLAARVWTYTYFEAGPLAGKMKSLDGPRTDVDDVTHYEYYTSDHAAGDYLSGDQKAVVNPLGQRTDYLKYDGDGRLLEMSDINGVVTSLTYHLRGWQNSTTTDGKMTSFTYDSVGNLVRVTQADGSFIGYHYDVFHRLVAISDSFNNRVEYTLDAEGNRISENIHDDIGNLHRQLGRAYDTLSRLVSLVDGNNEATKFEYDNNGNRTSTLDANLNTTSFEYNALGRLVKTTNAALGETLFNYDDSDHLVSVTDPLGNATHYSHDGLDNQTHLNSPDTGLTSYDHDEAGNRTFVTNANGIGTEYSYDALNRLNDISYPDSTLDVSFTYDAGTHGNGRLTGMADTVGTVEYSYDARGNLLGATRSIGFNQYVTSYAYNQASRLTRITYPSGMVIDYTLDTAGRIIEINSTRGTVISGVQYEPFGPVSSFNYGNGLSYSASFDQDYELDQLQSGQEFDWLYSNDPVGNILAISDQFSGQNSQSFSYDDLYRLETAQSRDRNETFEYDANGNRTRYLGDLVEDPYTYESHSNRLATQNGWTFTRDANGSRTGKLDAVGYGYQYAYGDHNRLSRVILRDASGDMVAGDYKYDGRGQRASKSAGGEAIHFIYGPAGDLLGEYSSIPGSEFREYVYLGGRPVAVITRRAKAVIPAADELILDNGDPGTSGTGSWKIKSSSQDYGGDYLFAQKAPGRTYRWTVTPPGTSYEVYAWWAAKKNQAENVYYTIRYGAGETDTVVKSHKTGGGQWQLLGAYYSSDGRDYVEVSSQSNKFVADAIRWVAVGEPAIAWMENMHFIHFDHLGTPHQVTDDSQTVVWHWHGTPFGDSIPDQDPDGNSAEYVLNLRFPGQYYDSESGLHYNYFRTYDPGTGRYIESDPIGLRGALNTFAYVESGPINSIDPSGLIKIYGSWCGPNWSGGFKKSFDELDTAERSVVLPPIDVLDQCCQSHDLSYAICRTQYPCDAESRQRCFQKADKKISSCASNAGGGQSPTIWLGGDPQSRIEAFFGDRVPPAEDNAEGCECE